MPVLVFFYVLQDLNIARNNFRTARRGSWPESSYPQGSSHWSSDVRLTSPSSPATTSSSTSRPSRVSSGTRSPYQARRNRSRISKVSKSLITAVDVIKHFFGGNLENLVSPPPRAETAMIGHFKSNKQFLSIFLLVNSIVTFLLQPCFNFMPTFKTDA